MYLFDFDGTLLDSNGVWLDIDVAFLGQRGVSPVPQDYTEYVTHHGFHEAAVYTRERFHLEDTAEEIMDAWREMGREAYGHSLEMKSGARQLLERLHRQGEELNILTSCMPELLEAALAHHGLEGYFAHTFTSAQLGMEKRDPEIYRQVARLCGVAVEDCTFFDDAPTYCDAARQAGMEVVGVYDPLFTHRSGEMEAICHRYLRSLEEFWG